MARYVKGEEPYPHKEEGMTELLSRSKIRIADTVCNLIAASDIIFCAPQTPHSPEYEGITRLSKTRSDFDYSYLKSSIEEIAEACNKLKERKVIAVISTCLPGTFKREIKPLLNKYTAYAYVPQFIAMGTVLADYLDPEFNLIGIEDGEAAGLLEEFYKTINNAPCVRTDITTAEGIKVSYNTWITAKTVIANAWGELSEKMGMNFDDIYYAWRLSTKRILSDRYTRAGMSDGGGCFPAGELVMTRNGMRSIETINPGDEVLTAEGTFEKVVKRWERHYDGDLVTVQVRGLPPVRMTTDHPVLVRTDGRKRVPDGRRNTYNRIIDKLLPMVEIPAGKLSVDSMIGWPHIKDGSYPLWQRSYVELAGWYLLEGSVSKNDSRIYFSLHAREVDDSLIIERCITDCLVFEEDARTNVKISHSVRDNKRDVRCGNHGLRKKLVNDFGKGAASKFIPEDILWGDLEQAKVLLRGLIRGDGHRSPQGISYSTISEQLAWGVFILLHRLGLNPTVRDIAPRVGRDGTAHQRAFEVRVRNRRLASELCEIVDWLPYEYDKNIQTYADDGLMIYRHVQKIEQSLYSGPVYNLWVDKIHSYIVGCGAVSNCHPRDNIALSWLAQEVGMSHNIWDDLMQSRESYEEWHARYAKDVSEYSELPLILLGSAFKPETDITTGSPALLMANILREWGTDFLHYEDCQGLTQAVYFIATQNSRYLGIKFAEGSIVIDPFGYIPDQEDVQVIRLGRR